MLDLPPAIASAVPELYRDARVVDYAGVVATAWLFYDIIITFSDEVEHVWRTPWTVPKACFFFSRYAALVIQFVNLGASTKWITLKDDTAFDNNMCTGVSLFKAITGLFMGMSVEIIMLLRVHALYGKKRKILIFLTTIYITELAIVAAIMGVTLHRVLVSKFSIVLDEIPTDSPLTGCYPIAVPLYFCSYWIAMILFQSILFLMMSMNVVRAGLSHRVLGGTVKTPLLTIFFRDGTVFYAMILAALLTNLILFRVLDSPISQFAVCLHLSVLSVSCSRLILNLRTLTRDAAFDSIVEPSATQGTILFKRTVPHNTVDLLGGIELEAANTHSVGYNIGTQDNGGDTGSLLAMEFAENVLEACGRNRATQFHV